MIQLFTLWKSAMSTLCCVSLFADEPLMAVPPLSDGVEANLTCSAPFPCPETPPDITWWIKTREGNIINPEDDNITLITSTSLYLSTLTLTPTSELHNATVGCDVNYGDKNISTSQTLGVMCEYKCTFLTKLLEKARLFDNFLKQKIRNTSEASLLITVELKKYFFFYFLAYRVNMLSKPFFSPPDVQTLRILGNDRLREGDTLSLICTVESHPPSSDPVWSFNGSTDTIRNHTSAENLMITNVRKEHAGIYVCEMTYRNETLKASITISVIRK